jgi:hypothetical protein
MGMTSLSRLITCSLDSPLRWQYAFENWSDPQIVSPGMEMEIIRREPDFGIHLVIKPQSLHHPNGLIIDTDTPTVSFLSEPGNTGGR